MYLIDWCIVFTLFTIITVVAVVTRKYTQSVADFLVANRCAGRYIVSVSQGIAGIGSISIIAGFEMFYKAGFTANWWKTLMVVVITLTSLSGWIIYRFRETRALTLSQFLEIRYSRKFRIFSGIVAYTSGIINFGIFPAVGTKFIIYFCDLPNTFVIYAVLMAVLIGTALFFTLIGGQIAVIITDFLQGVFCNVMFVVIMLVLLYIFPWENIIETLKKAPTGNSLIHPFHTSQAKDFNILFYLIMAFEYLYSSMVWQGSQGYKSSALNAHEARMGAIVSTWRTLAPALFMMIVPICAYTFLHHPCYSATAAKAYSAIDGINLAAIRNQMTVPITMKFFLPKGLMGCFLAVMIAAFIGNHDTYMHSWGSIFIQDVIMPFRKQPFSTKQHLKLLRLSIIGVAVFIYLFSLFFRQTDYIYMFFMLTGAIYGGGAGAAVIGGLYWRRGTTTAAWAAMIVGSSMAFAGIILQQINQDYPFVNPVLRYIASQNGAILSFYAAITAILVYVAVSLFSKEPPYDLDKMLHRGQYTLNESNSDNRPVNLWRKIIGMGNEFKPFDKVVYLSTIAWTWLWIIIFIFGTIYNFVFDVKDESWIGFWKYYVWITLGIALVVTVWISLGGFVDLFKMFRLLKSALRSEHDNGMVINHTNRDEIKNSIRNHEKESSNL